MNKPLAIVSLSGGLDSTVLLSHMLQTHKVAALSFNYGQRHIRELVSARSVIAYHRPTVIQHPTVNLRDVGNLLNSSALTHFGTPVPEGHYEAETMKATVVPNRNAIMANIAVGIGSVRGAELVVLGMHAGDHAVYPDCRPEFVTALQNCTNAALEGFHSPRIEAPFVTWSKADIVKYGAELKAPMHLSYSCYKGGENHCGRCGTCVERIEAFLVADVEDKTVYDDKAFAKKVLAEKESADA